MGGETFKQLAMRAKCTLALCSAGLFILLTGTPGAPQTVSVLQLAQLSDAVYSLNRGVFKTSGSYGLRHTVVDAKSGFQAGAFELKNGAVVIAFAGTQLRDPMDLLADVGIARGDLTVLGRWVLEQVRARLPESERARLPRPTAGLLPGDQKRVEALLVGGIIRIVAPDAGAVSGAALKAQASQARSFYKEVVGRIKKRNGEAIKEGSIVVAGHSLGGFLAQVVGASFGRETQTFNAPGARGFVDGGRPTNITNHVREHDVVGCFGEHLGKVVVYPDVKWGPTDSEAAYLLRNHSMEAFVGSLSQKVAGKTSKRGCPTT